MMYVVYYLSSFGNGLIFCGVFHDYQKAAQLRDKVQGVISSVTLKD